MNQIRNIANNCVRVKRAQISRATVDNSNLCSHGQRTISPFKYHCKKHNPFKHVRWNSSQASEIQVFHDVLSLREYRRNLLLSNCTVGLVPTMGALHEGHLSLVRHAAAENSNVFVSIYVNPTQFGTTEDFGPYPRTWNADLSALKLLDEQLANSGAGRISAIFAPTTDTMYPVVPPDSSLPGVGAFVEIRPLGQLLEGTSRPVFFRGVATVCMKLFNICTPDRVYFGQKDVQQTVVIKRMVKDFHLGMDVRVISTSRESDGLALSSRNVFLGSRRRKVGLVLSQSLRLAEQAYLSGKRKRADILGPATDHAATVLHQQRNSDPTERALFEVDYISLADPDTMEEIEEVEDSRGAVLSAVIKMLPIERSIESEHLGIDEDQGPIRLLDNIIFPPLLH